MIQLPTALARQSAIDTGGMNGLNANLIFFGVLVVIGLLYLTFHAFFAKVFGTRIAKSLEGSIFFCNFTFTT